MQNKNLPPFDPLEDMNPEKFYFDKMFMNLDKSLRMLIYTKHDLNTNNMIYIDKLEKIEVSKKMKTIDIIHKTYKNLKKQLIDPENYFQNLTMNENKTSDLFNQKYRNKCLSSKFYLLMLILRSGMKFELIFQSYDEYKSWIKGFECILKNKTKLALLKSRIK